MRRTFVGNWSCWRYASDPAQENRFLGVKLTHGVNLTPARGDDNVYPSSVRCLQIAVAMNYSILLNKF